MLPVDEIVELLSNLKFNVATSDSAGEYLCNYGTYSTLHHIVAQQLPTLAGLIHASPLREEVPDLTKGEGVRLKQWIDLTEAGVSFFRAAATEQSIHTDL